MKLNSRKPIRQGDVLLIPLTATPKFSTKLPHLTLAEGEVTGHSHRIASGDAELYERNGTLYLKILSDSAVLNHEEHHSLDIPQGNWMIRIQREYYPVKPTPKISFVTPSKPVAKVIKSSPPKTKSNPEESLELSPKFMQELLQEASYWENQVNLLEKQKQASDRKQRKIAEENEEEETQKRRRRRRLTREEWEERRQVSRLIPLIQDPPKPTPSRIPSAPIRDEFSALLSQQDQILRNWRNVAD